MEKLPAKQKKISIFVGYQKIDYVLESMCADERGAKRQK
jgi:hypothetical protein